MLFWQPVLEGERGLAKEEWEERCSEEEEKLFFLNGLLAGDWRRRGRKKGAPSI